MKNATLLSVTATVVAALAFSASKAIAAEAPLLHAGVVSDIHVKGDRNNDLRFFRKVLERFRDERVDAVVIPGDLVDDGQDEQLEMVAAAWREVFPGDALPDGTHVEPFFIYGNHDSSSLSYGIAQRNLKTAAARWGSDAEGRRHLAAYDEAGVWKRVFGEDWAPVFAKTIKGFTFVGCHWGHEKDTGPWLEAHAEELGLRNQSGKPFFYVQHPHPGGTVQTAHGEFSWGNDGGVATRALAGYPNAIALSGHSHYPLTDMQSIWQGEFTSVNCSSSAYIGLRNARDNGCWDGPGRHGGLIGPVPVTPSFWIGRHYMVMDVFADRVVFRRLDLVRDETLGPDWTVPLPACVDDASRPYSFAATEARSAAPQFPEGARATVSMRRGKDRSGAECNIVAVSFDAARSRGPDGRIFEYEVTAENTAYGIVRICCQKRIESRAIAHAADSEETGVVECHFRLDELPLETPVRFTIRPLNCFGLSGRPISTIPARLPLE